MNKYIFKVVKSENSSADEFVDALNCSRECIESVLDDENLLVEVSENTITISSIDQNKITNPSSSNCKAIIKGCFCDGNGYLYPEFSAIEPQQ